MTTTSIDRPTQQEVTRVEQTRPRATYRPNVDILEREEELTVRADMPGSQADRIDIRFENGTLTIHGRVDDRRSDETRYLVQEFGVGDFLRTFQVGEAIDTERISAEYSDGVLTLHLPKTAAAKPRRISVKAS